MLSKKIKYLYRAVLMAALFCLFSCSGGDDDGRRLGEEIVGTWQRGWGEGDVIIDGDTDLKPENFTYDLFYFHGDGKYNGMIRDGSFLTVDTEGEMIFKGTFQCDNNNLKLDCVNSSGEPRKILAQVLRFTEKEMQLRYVNDEYGVTVIIRKISDTVQ